MNPLRTARWLTFMRAAGDGHLSGTDRRSRGGGARAWPERWFRAYLRAARGRLTGARGPEPRAGRGLSSRTCSANDRYRRRSGCPGGRRATSSSHRLARSSRSNCARICWPPGVRGRSYLMLVNERLMGPTGRTLPTNGRCNSARPEAALGCLGEEAQRYHQHGGDRVEQPSVGVADHEGLPRDLVG
jgi:hypothetical protein